jgi:Prenyltransferase and squalene oxidase repeat
VAVIEAAQNPDGGWPYYKGRTSWTEPTVFALLSEFASGRADTEPFHKGVRWLRDSQNQDGGWAPQPGVGPSTWVTALVGLLPEKAMAGAARNCGTQWLLQQTGQESTMIFRVRQWMMGNHEINGGTDRGWPWFPGAAAWVMPTAISIIALKKEQRARPTNDVKSRIELGEHFLLSHTCKEGGWNHGSTHALGYESKPYPETTGVALLALMNVKSTVVDAGLEVAEHFLKQPNCPGAPWLSLALAAHSRPLPREIIRPIDRSLGVVDAAMWELSDHSYALFS